MKSQMIVVSKRALTLTGKGVCMFALAILATPVHGAPYNWDGQFNGAWDHAVLINPTPPGYYVGNWNQEPLPLNTLIPDVDDSVRFVNTTPNMTIDLNGNRKVLSVEFGGTVGYTLDNDVLNLITGTLVSSGSATHTINSDVEIGADAQWKIANTSTVLVNGGISDVGGGYTLTKSGTGTLVLASNSSHAGTIVTAGVLEIDNGNQLGGAGSDLTLDGGTLRAGAGFAAGSGRSLTLGANHGTLDTNGNDVEWQGIVDGTGNLTKNGGGTLTLSNANTFSGDTTINAGTLVVADADALQNSTVSIFIDGGLDVTTNAIDATIGGLAGSGGLDLSSQTLISGTNGASTTYSGVLTGTDSSILRHNGAGKLTLSGGDALTPSSFGTLRAQDVVGQIVIDRARINLTSPTYSNTTGGLIVTAGDVTLQNGADVRLENGEGLAVVNNATLAVAGNATSLTAVRVDVAQYGSNTGSMVVEDGASFDVTDAFFVGVQGAADLALTGGATISTLYLSVGGLADSSGDATVTGDNSLLSVSSLTFGAISTSQYGGTGTLTVESDGAVEVAGQSSFWTSASSLTVNGGTLTTNKLSNEPGVVATVSISDPAGGAALAVGTSNGSSTFDGLIQDAAGGPGTLKKTGTGTFTLTGANTYSGGTIIDGGTLALGHSSAAGTGAISVLGSTIDYADGINVTNAIDLQHDATLAVSTGSATQSGAIGETDGPFGVTKTGGGDLVLAAANTFSGQANISEGKIVVDDANALQHSTVSIEVDEGLDVTTNTIDATIGGLAGPGDLDLGSQTLDTGANNSSTTYSGVITGTSDGYLRQVGTGTLTLTGGDAVTPSNFGMLRSQNGSGLVVVDGARIDLTSPDITAGVAGLILNPGDVTLQNGADVRLVAGQRFALVENATLTASGSTTFLSTSRLDAAEFPGHTGSIVVEDGASVTTGFAFVGLQGAADLTVQSGGSLSASLRVDIGRLSGSSGTGLVTGTDSSISAEALYLGGITATQLGATGSLTVEDNGAVEVAQDTQFWTSASSIIVNGGTFETGGLANHTGVLATISISDPVGGTALTVGTNEGDSTFDGLIQDAAGGPGSLKKVGSGSFTLTGANTYSGGTTVDGGTLLAVNTSGSATGTGGVTVNTGGTLGGTGTVGGAVAIENGGMVAPGTSVGPLATDSIEFKSGSQLVLELAGDGGVAGTDFDFLNVAGNATINPGATLNLTYTGGFTASPSDTFVVLGAGTLNGTFDTVGFPDGQTWFTDYDTVNGTLTLGICADDDGDGVCNASDLCPDTIPGATVDTDGCPPVIPSDFDQDGDVDGDDVNAFEVCASGPAVPLIPGCENKDFDSDGDTDQSDFGIVQRCYSGPNNPGDPNCAD